MDPATINDARPYSNLVQQKTVIFLSTHPQRKEK
jgi:muramidase (phage lysozyme)